MARNSTPDSYLNSSMLHLWFIMDLIGHEEREVQFILYDIVECARSDGFEKRWRDYARKVIGCPRAAYRNFHVRILDYCRMFENIEPSNLAPIFVHLSNYSAIHGKIHI